MLMFKSLDAMVRDHGFFFEAWVNKERQVWVCVVAHQHELDLIRRMTCAKYEDLKQINELWLAEWMPVANASTIQEALQVLEAKLDRLPIQQRQQGSSWTSTLSHIFLTWQSVVL
ncbi:hypothetical protein [Pandoraea sp. NPDC090278]|uniref:hypothetical protein n=1 Tax=Pandoraea sp. NPDC090278 TaxID=3364391 RepID=UPI003839D8E1